MSVRTAADEHLDAAKDHLRAARKELLEVLDENTWGSDEFKKEYRELLSETAHELYTMIGKIGG